MAGRYLSAEELLNQSKKGNDLPDRGGRKDDLPDGSWLQEKKIKNFYKEELESLSQERVTVLSALSLGEWKPELGKVLVKKNVGKFWKNMGHMVKGEMFLLPEEALFLVDQGSMEIYSDDTPMSLQECYYVLLGSSCTLNEYLVYGHLARLGYVVRRVEIKDEDRSRKRRKEEGDENDDDDDDIKTNFKKLKSSNLCEEGDDENKMIVEACQALINDQGAPLSVPTSSPPSSNVPISSSPSSSVPISSSPSSNVPISPSPSSNVPISPSPFSSVPISPSPSSNVPISPSPSSNVPISSLPSSKVPIFSSPSSNVPISSSSPSQNNPSVFSFPVSPSSPTFNLFNMFETTSDIVTYNPPSDRDLLPGVRLSHPYDMDFSNIRRQLDVIAKDRFVVDKNQAAGLCDPKNWKDFKSMSIKEKMLTTEARILWEGDEDDDDVITPLVNPDTVKNMGDVFRSLKLFDDHTDNLNPTTFDDMNIIYDVFLPNSKFKKSQPGNPSVCIHVSTTSSFPTLPHVQHLLKLTKKRGGGTLMFAVVDDGNVSFVSFRHVSLPQLFNRLE